MQQVGIAVDAPVASQVPGFLGHQVGEPPGWRWHSGRAMVVPLVLSWGYANGGMRICGARYKGGSSWVVTMYNNGSTSQQGTGVLDLEPFFSQTSHVGVQ